MHRIPISDAEKASQHLKINILLKLSVSWQGFMQWGAAHNIEVQVTIHICSNKIFLKENCGDWKRQFIVGKWFRWKEACNRFCRLFIYCANYHHSDASPYPSNSNELLRRKWRNAQIYTINFALWYLNVFIFYIRFGSRPQNNLCTFVQLYILWPLFIFLGRRKKKKVQSFKKSTRSEYSKIFSKYLSWRTCRC